LINTLFTHCWLADTCISKKTNFNGYDIRSLPNIPSAESCMSSCYDIPQCVSFTYALGWTNCYIKYAQPIPTPGDVFDSGPKFCPARLFGKTIPLNSMFVFLYKSTYLIHLSTFHYGLHSLHISHSLSTVVCIVYF